MLARCVHPCRYMKLKRNYWSRIKKGVVAMCARVISNDIDSLDTKEL